MSPRFFFIHMLKSAGTSLYMRLPRHFGDEGVYPNSTDGDPVVTAPQLDVDQLLRRWTQRADEIRIVAGHFPYCTTELLGGRFITFTILRDPLERTLSFLRHQRKDSPGDRDLPLEAIYEQQPRFDWLIHNHMVKMLSLTTDEMTGGAMTVVDFDEERLARAKATLDRIDLVGLTEDFADFQWQLRERFGIDLGEPLHANRTPPEACPDSLRARIERDNALDIELYEYARQRHRARSGR